MTSKLVEDVQSRSKIANKVTKRIVNLTKWNKLLRDSPNNIRSLFNHDNRFIRSITSEMLTIFLLKRMSLCSNQMHYVDVSQIIQDFLSILPFAKGIK